MIGKILLSHLVFTSVCFLTLLYTGKWTSWECKNHSSHDVLFASLLAVWFVILAVNQEQNKLWLMNVILKWKIWWTRQRGHLLLPELGEYATAELHALKRLFRDLHVLIDGVHATLDLFELFCARTNGVIFGGIKILVDSASCYNTCTTANEIVFVCAATFWHNWSRIAAMIWSRKGDLDNFRYFL